MIYSYYPDPKIVEEKTYRYIELFQIEDGKVEIEEFKGEYYRIFTFTIKKEDEEERKRIIILNNKPESLFEETEIMIITIEKDGTKIWKEIVYEDIIETAKIEKEIRDLTDDVIAIITIYKLVF